MGIRIDGASDLINATDGSLTVDGLSINVTGIVTASGGFKVGSAATIHSNGNLGLTGIITATNFKTGTSNVHNTGYNVGTAVTIDGNTGNVALSGIITASSFSGIDLGDVTGATGDFSIADKIVHTGDTNTAIRFPTNDVISFEAAAEEHCRILDTGNFLVGATAVEDWDGSRSHRIQVRGTSSNNAGFSALITANDDNPSELVLGKSRGTGNTIVGSADDIGQIRWAANDGAGFHSVAWIRSTMDGTPGSDDLPSNMRFGVCADGGTTVSERMRITNSGQLLIGRTSNQTSRNNTSNRNPVFQVSSPWSSGRGSMSFECTDDYPIVFLNSNASYADNSGSGVLVWSIKDGSGEYCNTGEIRCEVDGTPGDDDSPGRMEFFTTPDGSAQPSERMRIDSSGRVIIARSGDCSQLNSNDAALHVTAPTDGGQGGIYIHCNSQSGGTVAAHYGLKIDAVNCANNANPQCGAIINVVQQYTASETGVKCSVEGSYNTTTCYEANLTKNLAAITNGYSYYSNIVTTNSGGNAYHFRGQDDGALAIYILENGNIQNANNSYGSTSDLKLKENIVDASSQWDDIKNVKVRKFNFKTKPSETFIGVVAQEIETTSPGLVHTENDIEMDDATGEGTITGTTKSVKYSILYMKAIKALQEAMARIETLETKVAALESA